MKTSDTSFTRTVQTALAILLAAIAFTSAACAQTFTDGEKGKVKGAIKGRNGDLVKVQDDKTGSMAVVKFTDDTKILRDKSRISFHRHEAWT